MNDKEKNAPKIKKLPLIERLRRSLDIPAGIFGNCSHLELSGRRELDICGCEGLDEYSDNEVALTLCDGQMRIEGNELELLSFSGGNIIARGSIVRISFGKEPSEGK